MMAFSFGFPQNYSSLHSYPSSIPSNENKQLLSTLSHPSFQFRAPSVNHVLPSINNLIHLPPINHIPSIPPLYLVPAPQKSTDIPKVEVTKPEIAAVEPIKEEQNEEDDQIAFLLTSLSQPTTITSPKQTTIEHSHSLTSSPTTTRPKRPKISSKSESEVDAKDQDSESSQDESIDFDETFVEVAPKRRRLPTPAVHPVTHSDSEDSGLSPVTPASPSNTLEQSLPSPTTSKRASKKSSNRAKYNDDLWFQHFEELKKFKKKYGHTNVTQSHKGSKTLANWVHNQRKNQGRNMPQNRRKMLEDIGFEFNRAYAAVTFNKKKKEGQENVQEGSSMDSL